MNSTIMTTKKPKIEAIYPLSYMQMGLLIHHLSGGWDQGFLNVVWEIRGVLNTSHFEKAWEQVSKRHAVLRTTIHWENLEKPMQIVHQEKSMHIIFHDWTNFSKEERKIEWDRLERQSLEAGSNLITGALRNITAVKFKNNMWRLLWPSHHILLDGWSSQIILNDVLTLYNAIENDERPNMKTLPSHKSYLAWLGNLDATAAHDFWSQYFNGFNHASLFDIHNKTFDVSKPIIKKRYLTKNDTENLQAFAKNQRVTLNTIVQGVWALTLNRFFNENDLAFGTVVSGRSIDFPNIELLSGMFMNIQPVRFTVDNDLTLSEWLNSLQKKQLDARKYEHVSLDKITSYINWPSSTPLFDSLLLFENYPQTNSLNGNLEITGFRSGLTSTYPVTMVVVPGDEIKVELSLFPDVVNEDSGLWLLQTFMNLLELIVTGDMSTIGELLSAVDVFEGNLQKTGNLSITPFNSAHYAPPSNEIEHVLSDIWKSLLGIDKIGIDDNYFDLGGKSMMAIAMFSEIEKKLKKKLSPTLLLLNPTIRSMAKKIERTQEGGARNWSYLVPLRPKGTKPPLFCFHAGEGHIMFYNLLPNHIDEKRPVYAIQPKGLDGNGSVHSSISEMVTDYLSEIEKVQGHGTYNFLFYCYNAIAVEIALQLKIKGKQANLIIVDSSIGPGASFAEQTIAQRIGRYFKKMTSTPYVTVRNSIISRYRNYVKPHLVQFRDDETSKALMRIKKQLNQNHADYEWNSFDGYCTLILCSADHSKLRAKTIASWETWSMSDVKVFLNSGNHFNQFEEPHVKTLGRYVEEAIIEH